MGAKGAKPQYATPYGAYGPRVGQIPNPAFNRPPYQRPVQQPPVYTQPAPAPVTYPAPVAPTYAAPPVAYAPAPVTYAAPAPAPVTYAAPAPSPVTYATPAYAAAPTYLPSYAPAPTIAAPTTGAAFALDAADGVIDGRYFGSQVGVAAPAYGYGTPGYGFGAPTYTSFASPAVASFPAQTFAPTYTGFGYSPSLAAPSFPTTSYASPATYASPYSFGSPYTATPTLAAPSVAGAFALDAADGVIDGKYFGAQVGVTAPTAYGAPFGAVGAAPYGAAPYGAAPFYGF